MEHEFQRLAAEWSRGTSHFSFRHQAVKHPSYRALLDLGPVIVPMLIEKLRVNAPGRWFYLLDDLVGWSPVRQEDAGNVTAMAAAWVSWYENRAAAG